MFLIKGQQRCCECEVQYIRLFCVSGELSPYGSRSPAGGSDQRLQYHHIGPPVPYYGDTQYTIPRVSIHDLITTIDK